jgi:hypothetical protein
MTLFVMIGTALLLIAYDIFVAVNGVSGDTISEVFLFLSAHPALPFAWGVLAGHLCWPQYKKEAGK